VCLKITATLTFIFMKSAFVLPVRRTTAFVLLTIGLVMYQSDSVCARPISQTGTPPAVGLRVHITPLPGSAVLRVRYESDDYNAVRLRILDAQGQVLYAEVKQQPRFAGDYILTSFPTGSYTLELQTPSACYTQTVRLQQRTALVATLAARPQVARPYYVQP
jgi:hypothetical protein